LIKYRAHYLEYPIKFLRVDNAHEFKSYVFEDYCEAPRIPFTGRSLHCQVENHVRTKKIYFF
jgi:hypothetical protein